MKKAQPTLVAEVFEFDSSSSAHEALMHARRGFIQPFFRSPPKPKTKEPKQPKELGNFFSRLFSAPFEQVEVRDDLGCGLFIWVNVPRWHLWLLGKRLPLLLLTTALLAISGSLLPFLFR